MWVPSGPHPTRGHTEDSVIIHNVSIFYIKKGKELNQLEHNVSDCHFCAAGVQLHALCSRTFLEGNKRQ